MSVVYIVGKKSHNFRLWI